MPMTPFYPQIKNCQNQIKISLNQNKVDENKIEKAPSI